VDNNSEDNENKTPPEKSDKPLNNYEENSEVDFIIGEESEPYLGPSWAVLMLVLYSLKRIFPAETFTLLWWFQIYILFIIFGITLFTLIKRYKYSQERKIKNKTLP